MGRIRIASATAVGVLSMAAPLAAWGALTPSPLHATPVSVVNAPELSVPTSVPVNRAAHAAVSGIKPETGDDSTDPVVSLADLATIDRVALESRTATRAQLDKALKIANVSQSNPNGKALRYPVNAKVSSPFGLRYHPILHIWRLHAGVDFSVACGTPVGAAANGTVTFAGVAGGYGNRVVIDNGTIAGSHVSTAYNHLSAFGVKVGQKVVAGQGIALSGTTGLSTGCHLHFEVLVNGKYTDPMPWLTGKPTGPSQVVVIDKGAATGKPRGAETPSASGGPKPSKGSSRPSNGTPSDPSETPTTSDPTDSVTPSPTPKRTPTPTPSPTPTPTPTPTPSPSPTPTPTPTPAGVSSPHTTASAPATSSPPATSESPADSSEVPPADTSTP